MIPQFRPVADHVLLVGFGDTITDAAHAAVLALDRALALHPMAGLREAVPAFTNILVTFDPLLTDHAAVEAHLRVVMAHPAPPAPLPKTHVVQVCYDAELAPDLAEVAQRTGLSAEAVISAHLGGDYRVFLYGFAPGYAYLGGLPAALRLDRKPAPLRGIAAGSVIIAGAQCLVTTLKMPTGWWIIGRSPTAILTGDPARPFLFDVGDHVRFQRVSRSEAGL